MPFAIAAFVLARRGPRSARGTTDRCVSSRASRSSDQPARNASATYRIRSAPGMRSSSASSQLVVAVERQRDDRLEAVDAGLEAAQRLLQRLLERAADRHHLAHRLHLRGEAVVGAREFLEREARNLGDDVVDRRLERCRRRAARDVVAAARRACSRRRASPRSSRSGNPVAFDASADERDTRGFISMTSMRPSVGLDRELHVRAAASRRRSCAAPRSRRRACAGIPCRSASAPARP